MLENEEGLTQVFEISIKTIRELAQSWSQSVSIDLNVPGSFVEIGENDGYGQGLFDIHDIHQNYRSMLEKMYAKDDADIDVITSLENSVEVIEALIDQGETLLFLNSRSGLMSQLVTISDVYDFA